MDEWPIHLTEAARRLGMAPTTVSTLVLGLEIPTRKVGRNKLIDEAGFERLKRAASRFPGKAYNRPRRELVGA